MKFFRFWTRAETTEDTTAGTEQSILGSSTDYATLSALISSESISEDNAKNIAAVVACIDKISETIASIPVQLIERDSAGKIRIIEDDNRLQLLNLDAGDTLSVFDLKTAIVRDYYLNQGGYIYIDKTGNRIKALRYVRPENVGFLINDDPIFRYYKIVCGGKQYDGYQFIKFVRHTDNGWQGKSIIEEHPLLLEVVLNSIRFEKNLVETGGNKKGFLKAPRKLAEEAISKLKAAWRKLYSNSTENVMILNDGIEFQEASNTSVEMQLNQNKLTNNREICKIFGIPPAIIEGNANESDKLSFIQYCLRPLFVQLQTELNRNMLLETEKANRSFVFDISELTKGDTKTRFEAYSTAIKDGFMQIDEVRKKENLEPIGFDLIKLGLDAVLYDPHSGMVYVPNTGEQVQLLKAKQNGSGAPAAAPTDAHQKIKTEGGEKN